MSLVLRRSLIDLGERTLAEIGFELVDVALLGTDEQMTVRVYADRLGTEQITIDDCTAISRYFSDVLDAEDPIKCNYVLEVSSPGLNRPLRTLAHFEGVVGETVKIILREEAPGRRRYRGELREAGSELVVQVDGDLHHVAFENIERANLVYRFDQ